MINSDRNFHTLIVGAGQAGLATSFFLSRHKVPHTVIDRRGLGASWKYDRWDSFTLVTPNWTIQLPGASYTDDSPDSFLSRDEFIGWLERWAESFDCPLVSGVEATNLDRANNGKFMVETTEGYWQSKNVVIATSTYQHPRRLALSQHIPPEIKQLDASNYRSPSVLPSGSVLVIGSGQTGCQIAEELNEAGYQTYLSTGKSGRLPRRYRGKDALEWQRDMGSLDRTPDMLDSPRQRFRSDPHISGKNGGHTLSLHTLRRNGITLLGHTESIAGNCIYFEDDLSDNISVSDQFAKEFMTNVDEYVHQRGLNAPSPTKTEIDGEPLRIDKSMEPIRSLNLCEENIQTVIWATGFRFDFSWIDFAVKDDFGYPVARGGITDVSGLYFCGLNWMTKRKSGIIYGVHEDASSVALHIVNRG